MSEQFLLSQQFILKESFLYHKNYRFKIKPNCAFDQKTRNNLEKETQ
jgi:hypothetical protein